MSNNKFIPLSVPYLTGNEKKYVNQCLDDNWISSVGEFIGIFETKISEYIGGAKTVAVVNGTSALHLALIAAGIGLDEDLFVPTLTFIAPINALRYVGAAPVFIDIDPKTLGLSPDALESFIVQRCDYDGKKLINRKTGHRIAGILPVHLYGHACDMSRILDISHRYGLKVIEDAAEAIGTFWENRHAGTFGDLGCFSFNGNKVLTTGGGGMIVSSDPELAKKIRHLSTQAKTDDFFYYHDQVGYNYRMLNIQAAIGLGQIEHLEDMIARKRAIAQTYIAEFKNMKCLTFFAESDKCRCTYWFFLIFLENNNVLLEFCKHMQACKIQIRPFWGLNHTQPMFRHFDHGDLSQSLKFYETGVCIPCHQGMTDEEVGRVVAAVKRFEDE